MGFRDTLKKWDAEDTKESKPTDDFPDVAELFPTVKAVTTQPVPAPQPAPSVQIDPQTMHAVPTKRTYARFTDMPGQKFTAEQLANIKPDTRMNEITAGIGGALQGATAYGGDELAAAVGALTGQGEYSKLRDENRSANKYAQSLDPKAYLVGEVVGGGLNPANKLIPGTAGKSLLSARNMATSAGVGGITGLNASEADLTKGEFGKAAVDTGIGAGVGAGVNTGLGAGGKAVRYIAATPERAAKRADNILIDKLSLGATAAERDGMVGELGKDVPKVLNFVRTTPELKDAVLSGNYGRAVEILKSQKAAAEKLGESTISTLESRWGKQDAQPMVDALEKLQAKYAANPAPESQKMAAEFQKRIDSIKERWIPEPPKQLTADEKLAALWEKATPEQRQEISANLPKFRAMAENTGMLDKFDNPAARASIADEASSKASIGLRSSVSAPGAQADAKRMVAALENLRAKYADNPALESQKMAAEYQKRIDAIKERWVPEPQKPEPKGKELLATLSEGASAAEKQKIGDNSELFEKVIKKHKLGPSANDPEARYAALDGAVSELGKRRESLYGKVKEPVLITDVTIPLTKLRDELSQTADGTKLAPAVEDMIKRIWSSHGRGGERLEMNVKELRDLISKTQEAGFAGPYFDPSVAQGLQRQVSGVMKGALDSHIAKHGGKKVTDGIAELNKEFQVLLPLRDIAERNRASARLVPPAAPETRTGYAPLPDVLDLASSTSDREARNAILSSTFGGISEQVGSSIDDIERLKMLGAISRRQQAEAATAAPVVVPPDTRTGKASVGELFELANATENPEAKAALMSSLAERMDPPSAEQLAKINADKALISQIEAPLTHLATRNSTPATTLRARATEAADRVGTAILGGALAASSLGRFDLGGIAGATAMALKYGPKIGVQAEPAMAQMVTALRAGAQKTHLDKIGKLNKLPQYVIDDMIGTLIPRTVSGDVVGRIKRDKKSETDDGKPFVPAPTQTLAQQ